MPAIRTARELDWWADPGELFQNGPARAAHAFWLDGGPEAVEGWSWLGYGTPADAPRAARCAGPAEPGDWGSFTGGWVGWFAYDDAAATGLRVDRFVAVDHSRRRLWAVAAHDDLDAFAAEVATWRGRPTPAREALPVRSVTARHTPAAYATLIDRCRAAIRDGDAYQLCLTTRFDVEGPVDPVDAYLRLRASTPAHHGGYIRVGAHALLSASPERFLQVQGGIVRTRPIKGTRPRADDPVDDAALAAELRDSVKERAENVMIVDLMRNDLQRVCEPGSVAAERLLEVESYPAVHQLVSTVAGRLRPGIRFGDLLAATFPAGSMTGAPKQSAMRLLRELESEGVGSAARGVYSGCFGWIGDDGAADLAMVIRSIVTGPEGAYVGAGGGITWGSQTRAEIAEVAVKARAPLAALGAQVPPGWWR